MLHVRRVSVWTLSIGDDGAMKKDNSGLYLVMAAFFTLVLASLCALSLGLGYVFASRAQMQVLSNIVSTGALDKYINSEEENEQLRRQAALEIANILLAENRKPGTKEHLELILDGQDSKIFFGVYYPTNPDSDATQEPTCTKYPCFKQVESNEPATAIRVVLQNPAENPVGIPFGQVLGYAGIELSAVSTAAIIETCGAYVLDISLSTVSDTHKLSTFDVAGAFPDSFPALPKVSEGSGMFAINRGSVMQQPDNQEFINPYQNYPAPPTGQPALPFEFRHWAYMFGHDGMFDPEDPPEPFNPNDPVYRRGAAALSRDHFWSDYREMTITFGGESVAAFVDLYMQPEPMRTFFLGFNAGLRLVDAQATVADQAMMLGFTNDIHDRREPLPEDASESVLTNDFSTLLHITNMNNAGTVTPQGNLDLEIKPNNYIERGWLPVLYSGHGDITGTNIVGALETALADLSNHCPPHSRKFIVLATQGQSTCLEEEGEIICRHGYSYDSEGNSLLWELYKNSEWRLQGKGNSESVLSKLREADIALSVLLAGETARPNYRNLHLNSTSCDDDASPDCFHDFNSAQSDPDVSATCGYSKSIVDCSSGTITSPNMDDKEVYHLIKQMTTEICNESNEECNPVFFGRPNSIFAHMAMETGGQMCPIMAPPPGGQGDYICTETGQDCDSTCPDYPPCRLKNSVRTPGGTEWRPLEYLSPGAQAARCVINTLGSNRLILVEPQEFS